MKPKVETMSDVYPITLAQYKDLEAAGLIDEQQIYAIYGTDDDIAQELIRTHKALDVAVDTIKNTAEYLGNQQPLIDVMAFNLYIDLSKKLDQIKTITKGGDND